MKHNGVDFNSGRGAEVYSAAEGKVVISELNRTFGNYVVVEHKDGHSTAYAHLESINVRKGNYVTKGQLLGYTGNTGRSTGPHLHYEVRINGTPVNPKDFLVETK
jgi:murein DD-endopeptidase MepM/ murein hydrolase activator NlpD